MSNWAAYTLVGLLALALIVGVMLTPSKVRCSCVGPCIPDPCLKENLREFQRKGMPISDELIEAVGKG